MEIAAIASSSPGLAVLRAGGVRREGQADGEKQRLRRSRRPGRGGHAPTARKQPAHPEDGERVEHHEHQSGSHERPFQVTRFVESIAQFGHRRRDGRPHERREGRVGLQKIVGEDAFLGAVEAGRVLDGDR